MDLSRRRRPTRAVYSPVRASASAAAADTANPLARGSGVRIYDGYLRNLRAFPALSGVLTQRLATGMIFCRDSFGGVLSDLQSPGTVGFPAGAAVVRSCAADRNVEMYDMFHTPGANMPRTGFVAMVHETYVQYFTFSAKSRDFNLRAGRVLPTDHWGS